MRTKTQVNRLGLYDDIRQVLDAALKLGGGKHNCPSHGMAVHWRQRAYKFRKLYAEILSSGDKFAMSPYDKLTLPQIPKDSKTVIINVREAVGTFIPNREPYTSIDIPIPGDDLFDVAKSIANKIREGEL